MWKWGTLYLFEAEHNRKARVSSRRQTWNTDESSGWLGLESGDWRPERRGLRSSGSLDATTWGAPYTGTGKRQRMTRSLTIEEDNLSVAWAKALLHVVEEGEISPLIVVIRGFIDGQPMEVAPIRQLLDNALGSDDKGLSCHEVANTSSPFRCGTHRPIVSSSTSAIGESCRVCCGPAGIGTASTPSASSRTDTIPPTREA